MLLLAVSGGIDSVCLTQKVRLEGGPFAIAHCNFGLRGAESDADEAFVRSLAASLGVTCHVKRFDTEAFASAEGISIEMAARRLRYHWFGELCREFGYRAVAVAHNANDNAETLMLNLLRGTGLRGITGMKAEGFLPDPDFADIPLLRPLLGMTREEIEAFAAEQGLSWREDSSNAANDFKRNKIRNLVFPVFREINPRFVETLNRDMERFREECTPQGACPPPDKYRGRGPLETSSCEAGTQETVGGAGASEGCGVLRRTLLCRTGPAGQTNGPAERAGSTLRESRPCLSGNGRLDGGGGSGRNHHYRPLSRFAASH